MFKKSKKNSKKIKNNAFAKTIKEVLKPKDFDPYGSYTGLTEDGEKPVQDQDDL